MPRIHEGLLQIGAQGGGEAGGVVLAVVVVVPPVVFARIVQLTSEKATAPRAVPDEAELSAQELAMMDW